MFYQRFTFQLFLRLLLINALAVLLYWLCRHTRLWFSITATGMLLAAALFSLYRYISLLRTDITRFVTAVKTRDHGLNFKLKRAKGSFPELYTAFDDILLTHKNIQLEQDSMFQLIRAILQQIPAGLLVIREQHLSPAGEEIVLMNEAASGLLQVPVYRYWQRLSSRLPAFGKEIEAIRKGGKRFLELRLQDKLVQLSVQVIPLQLYGSGYIIVSFQNIKDEIEQKENEAWNRLTGVISHEILNSITPISSLSDTISTMVMHRETLNREDLNDLRPAIQTIKRRSEGLLDFVKDYRLIAELPSPQLQGESIGNILQHISQLMSPVALAGGVRLITAHTGSRLTIQADLKLIEQALINLVTNSIYALEQVPDPVITISYRVVQQKVYIDVTDNGKGIEAELLEKIFVPFYTTRKNGSGIGLTITRNIMKMHQGSLELNSVPFQRTVFSLVFNYI